MPSFLFLSALRRVALLLPFLLILFQSLAQSTCDITGPSTVCVGDLSVYHITVQSPTNYNIEWITPNGTPMGSDNEMVAVHWDLSGTVQMVAQIRSAANPAIILGACPYTVNILAPPNPEIEPQYLPTGNCVPFAFAKFRPVTGFCGGSQAVFVPNGGGGDYVWTVSGSFGNYSVDNNDVLTVELGASGQVTICLQETNSAGCSREVCEEYDIYAPPASSFTEVSHISDNPIFICRGEQLIFQGAFTDPNNFAIGGWFWEIKNSSGTIVGAGSEKDFAFTFEDEETYTVTLYATNCLGCSSPPTSVTVEVNSAVVPEIICPSVVCQSNEPVQYCTNADCGSFLWKVNGGTIQGPDNEECVNIVWDMPVSDGYGLVQLEVANCQGNVCLLPTVVEVPVIPVVQPIDGAANLCDVNAQGVTYSVPYWPGAVYTWSRIIDENQSGGTVNGTANGNEFAVDLTNFFGKFRVLVSVTHPVAGCVSAGELPVNVQNYSIQGGSYCYGSDVSLQISPAPAPAPYEVVWKVQETNWSQPVNDAPGITIPFSAFGNSGNFIVKAVIMFNGTQMFECDALSASVTIRDVVPPVADVLGPKRICPEEAYSYSALPALPGTLHWTVTGGTPATATASVVNITWASGQSPYSATITRNYNGCTSDPFTLYVADITNLPLDISGNSPVCEDGAGTYTANIDGAESYNWSISPFTAGSIISGQGTSEITVQWHQFVSFSTKVKLTANVCGVSQTVELPVSVIKNAVNIQCPTFGLDDCRICQGNEVFFTLDNNTGTVYEWFVDDVPVAPAIPTILPFTFDEPGTHFIRVRMTGPPNCPGVFEDALSVEVLANPEPIISASSPLNCNNLAPLTLSATTYPGATSETFIWSHDGASAFPPVYTPTPPPNGPQLIVSSNDVNDYLGIYAVQVTRTIGDLTCYANASYGLDCASFEILPNDNPDVIFADWVFDLGIDEENCPPDDANECGYIIVSGNLNGRPFADVEAAEWRVSDPNFALNNPLNNPLNLVDVFPITNPSLLQSTPVSIFSKAGFYPAALRVKFIGDPNYYSDLRTLEIPLKPDLHWSYECSATPGMYELKLRDISELVPEAIIHNRQWAISINNGPLEVVNDNSVEITRTVPAGASITVSLTPYTYTVGDDKPGMLYYCTHCIQIDMPDVPMADIMVSQNTVCMGNPVQFEADVNPDDQIIQYDWNFADGSGSSDNDPIRAYPFPGDYIVTLTATTSRGCELMATEEIHVQFNGLSGFIDVMYDNCLASAALMYHPDPGSSTPVSWQWSPGNETTEAIMVMNTGVYDVTVTDGIGCKYSPGSESVDLPNLFSGGIQGDLVACSGEDLEFSITGTSGFTYAWTSDLPGFQPNNTTASADNVSEGNYSVSVTAIMNGQNCVSISESVVVRPLPTTPAFDVDYECAPFRAHIATDPSQSVAWSFQGNAIGFGTNIWANEGGQYIAEATNQYGCEASASTTVADPVNVEILSGCYELCDTELENDCIVLPAPNGSFTSWEWVLLPATILDSGTGEVNDLCLTAAMEGEIVLRVQQNYQNSNPPPSGSIITCEDESETFCLDVLECSSCPDLTITATVPEMLCMFGAPGFDEQVVKIRFTLHLPDGYEYCGNLPTFNGGYLNPPVSVYNFGTFVRFEGYLHVTDQQALEAGMPGVILLCDEVTGEQCPAKFQLKPFECEEPIWCMYMTTITYNYYVWPQTATVKFTFPAHYVTGPFCNITQYTATVANYNVLPPVILAQQTFAAQPPADLEHNISFTMPINQFNQLGCIEFSYQSNCELGCTFYPCFGEGGQHKSERNDENAGTGFNDYLHVQPNPAQEIVQLSYGLKAEDSCDGCDIKIRNSLGQIVSQILISGYQGQETLDVSTWPPGVYYVALETDGRLLQSKKLLIVK